MTSTKTVQAALAGWLMATGLGTVAATAQEANVQAEPAPSQAAAEKPDIPLIRDAVAAYRRGDLAAGDAMRARTTSKGAGAFLDWAAIRLGGSAIPFERIAGAMTIYPDFPNAAWLRRRAEEALLVGRRPAPLVRAFFSRERPQTPGGKFALAQAFRADDLPEDADSLIRETWRNDPFGRELELRILDAFKDTLTTADHRLRMERFLLRESWDNARRVAAYAGDGADALLKARIAVDDRAKTAPKLVDAVPQALKAEVSWVFSRVQNLRRTEKQADAAKVMADLTRDPAALGDGDAWWVERRIVSRKLLDDGDAKAAYAVAAGHGAATPERRVEAESLAGWVALRFLNEPATARRHFDRAASLATSPLARSRASYWQGRAAEAAGDAKAAAGFYRAAAQHGITYYGQLAAGRLGLMEVGFRPPGNPRGSVRLAASEAPFVQAVALAYEAGLRELAAPLAIEFGRASGNVPEIEAVGAILADNGDARATLTVGKLATQRGLPLDETAFPTFGVPPFEPVGPQVERAMVHAIARQESAFDPAAGSGAGARGLMQMMPGTASATAKKAGLTYEPGRILEAGYNAALGAAHLGDLMADWKGSLILTFASYNAGPGNVRKWIVAYGDPRTPEVDPVDWIERIPFSETRNYVQRVLENYQVYRRRLDERSALLLESDLRAPPANRSVAPATTATAAP